MRIARHHLRRSFLGAQRHYASVGVPFFQIDSFSPTPLSGNPAAVLLLPSEEELPLDDATLGRIAAENNLSETAFVRPADAPGGPFGLRWFTPTVALCGHGTPAAAAAIMELHGAMGGEAAAADTIIFDTLSGALTASRVSTAATTTATGTTATAKGAWDGPGPLLRT